MDCGNPSPDTGYIPATPGSTAENGTASVSCDNANGYTGTAADITCQADGNWTAYSGCTGMLIMNYGQLGPWLIQPLSIRTLKNRP